MASTQILYTAGGGEEQGFRSCFALSTDKFRLWRTLRMQPLPIFSATSLSSRDKERLERAVFPGYYFGLLA